MPEPTTELVPTEGWAYLSRNGVGAHYFRDGRSFCGRPLPDGTKVAGDFTGVGSDPEECQRCANKAHAENDALDAVETDDHFIRNEGGYYACDCGGWSSRTLDRLAFAEHVSELVIRPCEEQARTDVECGSCGEGTPAGECPKSKRPCGHHCNHVWTHDTCDWCGIEFLGDGDQVIRPGQGSSS